MSQHRCVHCGYDMSGTLAQAAPTDAPATCPECGKDWSREIAAKAPRWPGWPRFVWTCTGVQGIAMGVAVVMLALAHAWPFWRDILPNIAYPLMLLAFLAGWVIVIIVTLTQRQVAPHARPPLWLLFLAGGTAHLTLVTIAAVLMTRLS